MSDLKYTDKTPIEPGDCFFVIVGNDQFKDNIYHTPLWKLELNANSREITASKIKLNEDFSINILLGTRIPLLFKYLDNNKVIEAISEREMKIIPSSEYEYRVPISDTSILEDNAKLEHMLNSLIVFSTDKVKLLKPDKDLKTDYFELVTKYAPQIEKELKKVFRETENNFQKNFKKIVETDIFPLAYVENIMYDLGNEAETKKLVKKKSKNNYNRKI